jgi:hypothetical protein
MEQKNKIKKKRGLPKGRTNNPNGRPPKFTEELSNKIVADIAQCVPLRYASQMHGITYETAMSYYNSDSVFRKKCDAAKAASVRGLVALTAKQSGAWKLLKNLGKEEFKEHVEISYDESKPITIHGIDDDSEAI